MIPGERNCDAPGLSELDRICQEIDDDLPESQGVGANLRAWLRNIGPEFNLLGFSPNAHCRETRGYKLRRIQYLFVELCFTELDFGDIEHVGNDFEEMLSR